MITSVRDLKRALQSSESNSYSCFHLRVQTHSTMDKRAELLQKKADAEQEKAKEFLKKGEKYKASALQVSYLNPRGGVSS